MRWLIVMKVTHIIRMAAFDPILSPDFSASPKSEEQIRHLAYFAILCVCDFTAWLVAAGVNLCIFHSHQCLNKITSPLKKEEQIRHGWSVFPFPFPFSLTSSFFNIYPWRITYIYLVFRNITKSFPYLVRFLGLKWLTLCLEELEVEPQIATAAIG